MQGENAHANLARSHIAISMPNPWRLLLLAMMGVHVLHAHMKLSDTGTARDDDDGGKAGLKM